MTRNLIAAKTWKSGREKVCKECVNFGDDATKAPGYDWNNCRKQRTERIDYFSMWDGKTCCYFVPKGESK